MQDPRAFSRLFHGVTLAPPAGFQVPRHHGQFPLQNKAYGDLVEVG